MKENCKAYTIGIEQAIFNEEYKVILMFLEVRKVKILQLEEVKSLPKGHATCLSQGDQNSIFFP